MTNSVTNGKGLEWAVVKEIQKATGFQVEESDPMETARQAYGDLNGSELLGYSFLATQRSLRGDKAPDERPRL